MDVTVNIRGNAQGLKDELNSVSNSIGQTPFETNPGRSADASRQPTLPPSDRLVEDIRRTILQQGAVMVPGSYNYRQLLSSYEQTYRSKMNEDITNKYDSRRADAQSRMQAEYDKIDKDIEQKRQSGLANLGPRANDPFYRSILESKLSDEESKRYKKIGTMFDAEFDEIDKQEAQERTIAEKELTDAIKRLTGEFEKKDKEDSSGSNPDSYINQLREQRRKLLLERDNAMDESTAMAAQGRINAVDEQLQRVMNGGLAKQGGLISKIPYSIMGIMGISSSLANGDVGDALISGGTMAAMMKANPYVSAGLIVAGAAQKTAKFFSSGYDDLGNLAAYRSTSGGNKGGDAAGYLAENIGDLTAFGNLSPSDLNLEMKDLYAQASKRIRARGTAENWFEETIAGIGMERSLALEQDALARGAKYDRYGTNVTDAIAQLVTVLSGIKGSGVSWDDFTRVQEKYDIQQQLMASYMNRTDNPNYQWANNTLAAFSSTGVQQDSRMGEDITAFQNMIQNPLNERVRALIYGTVSDIFPETGGRMDLIDRAIRNPENEGKIMQAVVQRIQRQFGGTDTTMGYFAFKALLPNIAPDRLDEYVNQISSGAAGGILRKGEVNGQQMFDEYARNNLKSELSMQAAELVSSMTKFGSEIKNFLQTSGVKVFFGNGATPNATKTGN